jgi:hypothetical protein
LVVLARDADETIHDPPDDPKQPDKHRSRSNGRQDAGSSGDRPSRLRFNAGQQNGRAVLDPLRLKAIRAIDFFGHRRGKSGHWRRLLRKFRFGDAQACCAGKYREASRGKLFV